MRAVTQPADSAENFGFQEVGGYRMCWFGKLPSAGDFVSRRMDYAVQQFWDKWCAAGVEALKAGSSVTGLDVWGATPKWAFVLPVQPDVGTGQLGVLAPSCDRVGRIFPFVVAVPLTPDQAAILLDRAALLGLALGQVVSHAQQNGLGIEAVDAELHDALAKTLAQSPAPENDDTTILPQGKSLSFPWPDLARRFDLHGTESYWWSVPPAATEFQFQTQRGALKASHYLELCR